MITNQNINRAGLIIEKICDRYGLTYSQIFSSSRAREVSYPRMLAMALIREQTTFSYPEVAKIFNKFDHKSAIYAFQNLEKVKQYLQYDAKTETNREGI